MGEKILNIRVKTTTGESTTALQNLRNLLEGTTAKVKELNSSLNAQTGKGFTNLAITSSSLAELKRLAASLNNKTTPGTITQNPIRAEKDKLSARADTFRNTSDTSLADLNKRLALEQSARINGANSLKTLALKTAQEEQTIRQNLATAILDIEERLRNGTLTRITDANRLRVQAERDAASQITNIRRALEAEQSKVTRRNASADIYKQETAQVLTELNRRIALENSARVNGLNHIRTIELQAAHDEEKIRATLAAKLLAIEANLRSGSVSNRGAANAQRLSIIRQAEAQILLNAETLRGKQAQHAYNESLREGTREHTSFALRVLEGISLYRLYTFALNSALNALKSIPKIGIELETTNAVLAATAGSASRAASVMQYLEAEAQRTGISISTLRETFRNFSASTTIAGISIERTAGMFQNVNTVITALHLPADKASNIFLALSQIFNKTKVQSEELVKQLGNLLPGAFAAFQKANEKAFPTTLALTKAMKAGTVFAQETMEQFLEFYANRFAPSLAIASNGLNANFGRMKTSITLLGEELYKLSSGALIEIAKSITIAANYLKDAATGANDFGLVLKSLLNIAIAATAVSVGRLVIGFFTVTRTLPMVMAGVAGTSAAMRALQASMAFLSAPATIIAGLIAIGLTLRNLANKTQDARDDVVDFINDMKTKIEEQKIIPLEMKVELDPDVQKATKGIEILKKSISETGDTLQKVWKRPFASTSDILDLKARYRDDKEHLKYLENQLPILQEKAKITIELETGQALKDISDLATKMEILALRATGKVEQASKKQFVLSHSSDLASLQKVAGDETLTAENRAQATEAIKNYNIALANEGIEKTLKSQQSVVRDLYKGITREAKQATREMEAGLRNLGYAYEDNVISIEEYFNKKSALQERDLGQQIENVEKGLQIARNARDAGKIDELSSKKEELFTSAESKEEETLRAKVIALKDYKKELDNIRADALESQGDTVGADAIRINLKYLETEKKLRANNNVEALKQVGISKQYEFSKSAITALQEKEARAVSLIEAAEARVNVQREAGILTQQQAVGELIRLRDEYIKQEDIIIAGLEAELEKNKGNLVIAQQIADAKRKREELLNKGSGTAQSIIQQNQGSVGFLQDFNQGKAALDEEKSSEEKRFERSDKGSEALEAKLAFDKKYTQASALLYENYYLGIAGLGSSTFEAVTGAMQKMYGEQSTQAKIAFIAFKATKIAEVAILTKKSVMAAYSEGGYIGPILAGLAAAFGAAQVAAIVSTPLPAAHGGLDFVPKEQTYLLDKGERVVSPRQNKDLTDFMNKGKLGKETNQSQPQMQPQNIRIINAVDPSVFNEYLGTDEGEKVVMNIVRRNREAA